MKLWQGSVRLDIGKSFFTGKVIGHWNGLPKEMAMAPKLLKFKGCLDKVLKYLVWFWVVLCGVWNRTQWFLPIISHPISLKHIVISNYYVELFKAPIQFRTIAPQRFNDTSIITSLSSCLLAFFMLKKSYGKMYSYGFFFNFIFKVLLTFTYRSKVTKFYLLENHILQSCIHWLLLIYPFLHERKITVHSC